MFHTKQQQKLNYIDISLKRYLQHAKKHSKSVDLCAGLKLSLFIHHRTVLGQWAIELSWATIWTLMVRAYKRRPTTFQDELKHPQ